MTGTTVNIFASSTCIVSFLLQNRRDVKYSIHMFPHQTKLYAIDEMPNNELTSIHTLSLPPLHL